MSIAYTYNEDGIFVGQTTCQPNPRSPGNFLIPGSATTVDPGEAAEGKVKKWNGTSWDEIDDPVAAAEAAEAQWSKKIVVYEISTKAILWFGVKGELRLGENAEISWATQNDVNALVTDPANSDIDYLELDADPAFDPMERSDYGHAKHKMNTAMDAMEAVDTSAADTATAWDFLRGQRDAKLSASDWTQGADSPLTEAKKTEWATYRQTLRDLPGTVTDPIAWLASPVWPAEPTA